MIVGSFCKTDRIIPFSCVNQTASLPSCGWLLGTKIQVNVSLGKNKKRQGGFLSKWLFIPTTVPVHGNRRMVQTSRNISCKGIPKTELSPSHQNTLTDCILLHWKAYTSHPLCIKWPKQHSPCCPLTLTSMLTGGPPTNFQNSAVSWPCGITVISALLFLSFLLIFSAISLSEHKRWQTMWLAHCHLTFLVNLCC